MRTMPLSRKGRPRLQRAADNLCGNKLLHPYVYGVRFAWSHITTTGEWALLTPQDRHFGLRGRLAQALALAARRRARMSRGCRLEGGAGGWTTTNQPSKAPSRACK